MSPPTAIEIYNVAGAPEKVNNVAIDRLSTARPLLGVGEPFLIEAEIRNHGEISAHSRHIELEPR
ncbi:MAG: hypothetical protein U0872_00780 [Planctomycetaceae bacterium]